MAATATVSSLNESTIARWNGDEARQWVTHADRFDAMLGSYGSRVLAAARLAPGDRVLDIGCGTGATVLDAAWAVGSSGRVVGVDVSAPLLDHARHRLAPFGLDERVTLIRADAQTHPFIPARADAVVSRFGLMLFADPDAAFANVARALRPNGRFAFVTWQGADRNAWFHLPHAALAEHVPAPADTLGAASPTGPCPFSLADPARLHELLERAGLVEVRTESVVEPVWLGADPDDVMAFYDDAYGAGLRAALDAMTVERVIGTLREELAAFATPQGVFVPAAAWLVSATRSPT
jgi:SAM-dependent methyltransferase